MGDILTFPSKAEVEEKRAADAARNALEVVDLKRDGRTVAQIEKDRYNAERLKGLASLEAKKRDAMLRRRYDYDHLSTIVRRLLDHDRPEDIVGAVKTIIEEYNLMRR